MGGFAIQKHGEIKFGYYFFGTGDQQGMHFTAGLPGLFGDDDVAEHRAGLLVDFAGCLAEMNAALEPVLEHALAPSTGVDLNFHDDHLVAVGKQLFRDGPCFVGGGAGFPAGHLDPVLSQQLLGLIFVKIHFTQTPELA